MKVYVAHVCFTNFHEREGVMDNRTLMMLVCTAHREWRSYRKRASMELGIPEPYHHIIMYLRRHSGASQKEVADFCEKTPAAISSTIKDMINDGYIVREVSKEDQRQAILKLTDKGMVSAQGITDKLHTADAAITQILTKAKEDELKEELLLLIAAIKSINK